MPAEEGVGRRFLGSGRSHSGAETGQGEISIFLKWKYSVKLYRAACIRVGANSRYTRGCSVAVLRREGEAHGRMHLCVRRAMQGGLEVVARGHGIVAPLFWSPWAICCSSGGILLGFVVCSPFPYPCLVVAGGACPPLLRYVLFPFVHARTQDARRGSTKPNIFDSKTMSHARPPG